MGFVIWPRIVIRSLIRNTQDNKMKSILALVCLCIASTQAKMWSQCGGSALKMNTISLKQDKVVFPGPLDISFHAETLHAISSPIKILAKLPEDCKSTGDIIGTIIADAGLPCRCPFSKNPNVAVTGAHIDLPKVPAFLAFLAEGVIDIKAEAYDGNDNLLGCLKLNVDVHFEV